MTSTTPVALTIAGSDSGGGAGIQADLKTFHQFGVFGTSALTAITAQDTRGVHGVHVLDPGFVRLQIEVVLEDLSPKAVKSGMLANAPVSAEVADALRARPLPYVLDPVLVSSTGDRLLDEDAVTTVRDRLVPLATLVTPNLYEAEILTARPVRTLADQEAAARRLVELGAGAALVKGGHGTGAEVTDVLWDGRELTTWTSQRIESRNTHGTGCTLAAGVTAGLALEQALVPSIGRALAFVRAAIRSGPNLGTGIGPLDHFADVAGFLEPDA